MDYGDLAVIALLSLILPTVLIWRLVVNIRQVRQLKERIDGQVRDIRDFAGRIALGAGAVVFSENAAVELAEAALGLSHYSGLIRKSAYDNASQLGPKRLAQVERLLDDAVHILAALALKAVGDQGRKGVEWSVLVHLGRLQARLELMSGWPETEIIGEGLWINAARFVHTLHDSDVDMTALAYTSAEVDEHVRRSLATRGLLNEEG